MTRVLLIAVTPPLVIAGYAAGKLFDAAVRWSAR